MQRHPWFSPWGWQLDPSLSTYSWDEITVINDLSLLSRPHHSLRSCLITQHSPLLFTVSLSSHTSLTKFTVFLNLYSILNEGIITSTCRTLLATLITTWPPSATLLSCSRLHYSCGPTSSSKYLVILHVKSTILNLTLSHPNQLPKVSSGPKDIWKIPPIHCSVQYSHKSRSLSLPLRSMPLLDFLNPQAIQFRLLLSTTATRNICPQCNLRAVHSL